MDLSFVCLSLPSVCLFIAALLPPVRKGLVSWLSCMWCLLEILSLSHMMSWVRCGTRLYRFLIFAFSLTFMISLSDDKQADFIEAFNTTSIHLGDISSINNIHFDHTVRKIYPAELDLNKANTFDTEASFLHLHMLICIDIISFKIYDKRDKACTATCRIPDDDLSAFSHRSVA